MSVERIIQESINKNPLGMKEALEEEMKARVLEAIQEKMSMDEAKDDEDDEDDDDDDEDLGESFDLSDYTVEELEDFMMSEEFEQLDEISKKTLASYVKKANRSANKSFNNAIKQQSIARRTDSASAERKQLQHSKDFDKRATGIDRANARLTK